MGQSGDVVLEVERERGEKSYTGWRSKGWFIYPKPTPVGWSALKVTQLRFTDSMAVYLWALYPVNCNSIGPDNSLAEMYHNQDCS